MLVFRLLLGSQLEREIYRGFWKSSHCKSENLSEKLDAVMLESVARLQKNFPKIKFMGLSLRCQYFFLDISSSSFFLKKISVSSSQMHSKRIFHAMMYSIFLGCLKNSQQKYFQNFYRRQNLEHVLSPMFSHFPRILSIS